MKAAPALFGLVCVGGFVGALALTVHEARYVAPLETTVVSTARTGELVTVVAEVRNTTDTARCARVQVAARDREGRDLGVAPAGTAGDLGPLARRRVSAQLTVTGRQYAEQLQRFDAYTVPC